MKFDKNDKIEIFEHAISWIVVFAMFIYGFGKIIQFDGATEINKTVSEMTGMELMWAFYGYSKPFVYTLGLLEVTGGLLILIKRTRIIGCLFTSAILANVILQDIFYGVHLGALKAAIFYQLLIFIILWINRNQVMESIRILLEKNRTASPKRKLILKLAIAFVLFLGIRIFEYFITIKF